MTLSLFLVAGLATLVILAVVGVVVIMIRGKDRSQPPGGVPTHLGGPEGHFGSPKMHSSVPTPDGGHFDGPLPHREPPSAVPQYSPGQGSLPHRGASRSASPPTDPSPANTDPTTPQPGEDANPWAAWDGPKNAEPSPNASTPGKTRTFRPEELNLPPSTPGEVEDSPPS